MVKMADSNKADTTFSVFHSLINESINASQESLNRMSEGDTSGAVHSSGNGSGRSTTEAAAAAARFVVEVGPIPGPAGFKMLLLILKG